MFPKLNLQLEKLLSKGLKNKDSDVRALLLIGLYQLQFMRIPDHAVLDQTVSATSALGKKWARGLTNAVLRNALRKNDEIQSVLEDHAEFRFAHPQWLCEALKKAWGPEFQGIVDAGNTHPPMCLRVNTRKNSPADYQKLLHDSEIESETTEGIPSLDLRQPVGVDRLPGFENGLCSVQDKAAQLCAPLLDLRAGKRVLDACAAPGGKTGHLLETCQDITLTAMDISPERLVDVASNLERLGLNAELIAEDAANTGKWWDGKAFDRILLDAPCSGTGVIRRHPDIKLLRRPSDIQSFCQQQHRLLEALWPIVAEDGLLLYVTCSIMPEENEEQISAFVDRHSNARVRHIDADWGITQISGRQLLPSVDGPDGFYFALIEKSATT